MPAERACWRLWWDEDGGGGGHCKFCIAEEKTPYDHIFSRRTILKFSPRFSAMNTKCYMKLQLNVRRLTFMNTGAHSQSVHRYGKLFREVFTA